MVETLRDLERFTYERHPEVKEAVDRAMPRVRLAAALKRIRKAAGLTQRALAERIGWYQPAVARLESDLGDNPQTNDAVLHYAKGCGMAVGLVFLSKEDGRYRLKDAVTLTDDPEAEAFLETLLVRDDGYGPCRAANR